MGFIRVFVGGFLLGFGFVCVFPGLFSPFRGSVCVCRLVWETLFVVYFELWVTVVVRVRLVCLLMRLIVVVL